MGKKCIIYGAGEHISYIAQPSQGDLSIAADGGYKFALANGIHIDAVIGDFDSLGYTPSEVQAIKLPVEKDETDMLAAVKYGMAYGYAEFHIFGGTGGRLDHTLANIQLLAYLCQHHCAGFLYSSEQIATCIQDSAISFDEAFCGTISVLSYSPAAYGVTIKGLKYSLDDSMLSNIYPLGVSNSFIGQASEISAKSGMLLVCYSLPERAIEAASSQLMLKGPKSAPNIKNT
ncbi:MAG: thiamine diphosphokinase [Eubacteriaceae bacterium]|nr:thiamine diphosphokinase [Eubacteriaceae bacterium]